MLSSLMKLEIQSLSVNLMDRLLQLPGGHVGSIRINYACITLPSLLAALKAMYTSKRVHITSYSYTTALSKFDDENYVVLCVLANIR